MSELIPVGEALLRKLSEIEELQPGELVSAVDLASLMQNEGIDLPINNSMPEFLEFMLRVGWLETNNNGFNVLEQSFGITAKGLLRAASSVDYVDVFNSAMGALPDAPENSGEQRPHENSIPASDRLVRLDDNDPQIIEIKEKIDSLLGHLKLANDVGELQPDEVITSIDEIEQLRDSLNKPIVRSEAIRIKAVSALKWIGEKAAESVVGIVATMALTLIAAYFGFGI